MMMMMMKHKLNDYSSTQYEIADNNAQNFSNFMDAQHLLTGLQIQYTDCYHTLIGDVFIRLSHPILSPFTLSN